MLATVDEALDLDATRRRLRARRLSIMVRYQVEAVFRSASDGGQAARQDVAWVKLLTDEDAVTLLRIFEALRRIELGTFGQCAACGSTIETQRLAAEPEAQHCEVCATFAACRPTDPAHAH
jgi:RNA polymerase-binding transcription factor DksA